MPNTSLTRTYWLAMLAVVLVAAVGRALLLAGGSPSFHSDEAIVGLMARHILAGEPPTFFYGQAYMGSLDAWLVALGFRAFGESVATIRLVQALLYLGVVASAYAAAHALLRRLDAALIVGLLFAVGTPLLTLYTAATLGGYNETLLFGHLLIALTMGRARGLWRWALVGLIAGVGWWTNALIVVYILPLLVWGAWRVGRSAKEQGHSSFVGAQYIAPLQTDGLAHGAGLAPPTGTSSPLRAQSRQTPTDEAGLAAGGTTHGSSPTPSSPFASSPHPLSPHHLLSLSPQSSVLSTLLLLFLLGSAPWWLYALQHDRASHGRRRTRQARPAAPRTPRSYLWASRFSSTARAGRTACPRPRADPLLSAGCAGRARDGRRGHPVPPLGSAVDRAASARFTLGGWAALPLGGRFLRAVGRAARRGMLRDGVVEHGESCVGKGAWCKGTRSFGGACRGAIYCAPTERYRTARRGFGTPNPYE